MKLYMASALIRGIVCEGVVAAPKGRAFAGRPSHAR